MDQTDFADNSTRGLLDDAKRFGSGPLWPLLLGFALVVYLGLKGGGYDPLVSDQIGIAAWWIALLGVAVGVLPRRRLPTLAWVALALLAAYCGWTALSMAWTESAEQTWLDVARVTTYLGVFALALGIRGRRGARHLLAALGTAIAAIAVLALLSRLHPAWFPEPDQLLASLPGGPERLSYPLNYWNGLGALLAIGLPVVLQFAAHGQRRAVRALAAAALPVFCLTLFFTLSRSSIAAALIALCAFLILSRERLQVLVTIAIAAPGALLLILVADRYNSLQHGLRNSVAGDQGDKLLLATIAVCAGVAVLQWTILPLLSRWRVPSLPPGPRRWAIGGGLAVLVVCALALGAPGRGADAWTNFKREGSPGADSTRLGSVAGQGRYQFWSAALREAQSEPLVGTGSGTFKYWWARDGELPGYVRDTHSLYLQTLGELGAVGLLLLLSFLLTVLIGGGRLVLRASREGRGRLAAAFAGCLAFCVSAAFDWVWQIPVLAIAFLLLASVLVTAGPRTRRSQPGLPGIARAVFALAAIAAIVAVAVPLTSETLVRESQDDARAGDLEGALSAARSAQNVEPGAATPRLQEALVLESLGDLPAAAAAARAAILRESTNWRTWLVLSRLDARLGNAQGSVRNYRRARSLNPNSSLFR